MGSSSESTQQLIERYYYKGWNKADEAVVKEIFDENIKFRGALGRKPKKGHAFFLNYMQSCHQAIAKNTVMIEDIVVSEHGQKAAVRLVVRGVHKGKFFGVEGSNMEVSWNTAAFFTIVNGRVTELWVVGDVDNLKNQIHASADAKAFADIMGEDY
jgi:predicted ester cyclase